MQVQAYEKYFKFALKSSFIPTLTQDFFKYSNNIFLIHRDPIIFGDRALQAHRILQKRKLRVM